MNTDTTPACIGMPGLFFADEPEYDKDAAIAICASCDLRTACLTEALNREGAAPPDARFGIFGGLLPAERANLYRRDTRNGNERPLRSSRRLTELEHTERRILHAEGLSDAQIAARVGVHKESIEGWRRRYKLPPNATDHFNGLNDAEEQRRFDLHAEGMSDQMLANTIGSTQAAISSWRRRRGLPANEPNRKRLTDEERAKVQAAWESGYSDEEIAWVTGMRLAPRAVGEWRRRNRLPMNKRSGGIA